MKIVITRTFISISLFFLILTACNNDDDNAMSCDQDVIISAAEFDTAPDDPLGIDTMEINGDCLKILFRASGCNGDTWVVKLIDSGDVLESSPPQRRLRLSLKNDELCEALISKEITFDIRELRVDADNVLLEMDDNVHQILYEY